MKTIAQILLDKKKIVSMAEGRRLISANAIKVNDKVVEDLRLRIKNDDVVKVGRTII